MLDFQFASLAIAVFINVAFPTLYKTHSFPHNLSYHITGHFVESAFSMGSNL